MNSQFERTELMLGSEGIKRLNNSSVCVFGVGGVGSFVCEALARMGIGKITIVDNDTISISNLNRQIIALHSTIGKYKVDVMEERIKDINPSCNVVKYKCFYLPENKDDIDFSSFDYIVDAVDTLSAKITIISKAKELNIPIISSMGTGNKLNPQGFLVADINQTSVCPLARTLRYELKKRNIKGVKVVYSKEEPVELKEIKINEDNNKQIPASNSFVPSSCGLLIASEVIKDLLKEN